MGGREVLASEGVPLRTGESDVYDVNHHKMLMVVGSSLRRCGRSSHSITSRILFRQGDRARGGSKSVHYISSTELKLAAPPPSPTGRPLRSAVSAMLLRVHSRQLRQVAARSGWPTTACGARAGSAWAAQKWARWACVANKSVRVRSIQKWRSSSTTTFLDSGSGLKGCVLHRHAAEAWRRPSLEDFS